MTNNRSCSLIFCNSLSPLGLDYLDFCIGKKCRYYNVTIIAVQDRSHEATRAAEVGCVPSSYLAGVLALSPVWARKCSTLFGQKTFGRTQATNTVRYYTPQAIRGAPCVSDPSRVRGTPDYHHTLYIPPAIALDIFPVIVVFRFDRSSSLNMCTQHPPTNVPTIFPAIVPEF